MNERIDPFDLLVAVCPSRSERVTVRGEDALADALLARIIARPPRRRWGRRATAIGVVAVLASAGGATAARLILRHDQPAAELMCYSDAALRPQVRVVLPIDLETAPAGQCDVPWRDGTLGSDGPPHLVACLTTGGTVAVMPGPDGTCQALGLDPVTEFSATQVTAAQVLSALSEAFDGVCVTTAEGATARVQAVLDRLGASGWGVEVVVPADGRRECYFGGVDGATQRVLLSAAPYLGDRTRTPD